MASMIQLADSEISIVQACAWAGVDGASGDSRQKMYCPFGVTHTDSGMERAFRVYADTNTAYCFACGRGWTPVRLMSEFWDMRRQDAAEKMCKLAGVREHGWQERWEELRQPRVPDRQGLAEALKTWCRRLRGPSWETEQFQPRFADPLGACLGVLPLVSTGGEADEWLYGCKVIMGPLVMNREEVTSG